MPRVYTQTKNKAGRTRSCGRCGETIHPGETYYSFSFRFGGTHYRCHRHYPRRSELTQSKMSEVYSAIDGSEADLAGAEDFAAISAAVETVGEAVRNVATEYEEAAEAMGAAGEYGESRERADELSAWADELEGWEPDTEMPDADSGLDEDELEEAKNTALEDARNEARELLEGCPF